MEFFEGFLLVPFLGIVVTLPSEELSLGVLLASLFLLSLLQSDAFLSMIVWACFEAPQHSRSKRQDILASLAFSLHSRHQCLFLCRGLHSARSRGPFHRRVNFLCQCSFHGHCSA